MANSHFSDPVLASIVMGEQQPLTDSSLEELFLICAAHAMDDEDGNAEASLSIAIDCDEDVNWIAIDLYDDRGILNSEVHSVEYRRLLSDAEGSYVSTELMGRSEEDDEVFEHEVYVACEHTDILDTAADSLTASLGLTDPTDAFHAELKIYCLAVLSAG